MKVPYVIYADFECLLRSVEDEASRIFQEHEAYSIGYYLKCSFDDSRSGYHSYRQKEDGEMSPAVWFIVKLQELATHLEEMYNAPKPMNSHINKFINYNNEFISSTGTTIPYKNDKCCNRPN